MTDEIKEESARDEADYLSFLPGQRLKKAREVRGLTVEQVAKELHLSVRFVGFMEADSYKDLPEPAFVRGYMRRYAQLVKLSPDDIAGKFDQCYAADAETPAVDERPYNPIQLLGIITRPRLKLRRLLSWASIALIIALLVGFLWSGFRSSQLSAPETVQEAAPTPAAAPVVSAEAASPVLAGAPAAGGAGMNLLPAPNSSASVAAAPAPSATAAVAPAPIAQAAQAAPVAATGPDTLVLALGAESWISVQDAKRQPLLSALRPAGQITLKGEAPFYVNIGNAAVVNAVFNGKPVDLKPHTQGAVATLTLKR
ncbi:MAG: helix-turn-helix domain-containing protein [Pedobacter sp.]|nr:helix-turn-helix domain-containing protein [Pedobacter sp.]